MDVEAIEDRTSWLIEVKPHRNGGAMVTPIQSNGGKHAPAHRRPRGRRNEESHYGAEFQTAGSFPRQPG